jgi:hypothetical protein
MVPIAIASPIAASRSDEIRTSFLLFFIYGEGYHRWPGRASGGMDQARTIAFELSWQAAVSGCRKDAIEASFATRHDFGRAAKRSQEEARL